MKLFNNKILRSFLLAGRIWLLTSFVLGAGWLLYSIFFAVDMGVSTAVFATICAALGSLPVLLVMTIVLLRFGNSDQQVNDKISWFVFTCFICTLPYGLIGGEFFSSYREVDNGWNDFFLYSLGTAGVLFACSIVAMLIIRNTIINFLSPAHKKNYLITQTTLQMETELQSYQSPEKTNTNKTLVKGLITGALILLMMIPTIFVANLVTERERRQEDVVKEVSSKWATEQTIAGPYIYLPYTENIVNADNKIKTVTKHLLLLPDNLAITGDLYPEVRPRSIYKVLLYKSSLKSNGDFSIHLPKEIDPASLQLADAKLCFGITDFKGIEERIVVNFNGTSYELSPGLPVNDIDTNGLSAPINLTVADFNKKIDFNMQLKIKGSEQLHFVPLSGNSTVALQSSWGSPSFDGNNLPGERRVDEKGFAAKWTISKANLPFGTVLRGAEFNKNSFAFGVSMLQPADQYAKTMRSVKYAILFIGLTFSLFFIVEVMQKKPLHPVQYVLVGLALVIFYTLLLSFSEFILFDQAYLIASLATISLITLYAKGHFANWKTAGLFGGVLSGLYGFIFILIRLEDTALLVGSIGLFLVLAMVMYGSRKIDWYNSAVQKNELASA